jgi:FixJ family two-component response regulator
VITKAKPTIAVIDDDFRILESLHDLLDGAGFCRDELHRRALHRLGDRLSIAEVVLLASRVGPHIFGWHQPSV